MMVIYLCLLKALHWKASVPQTKEHHRHIRKFENVILYFTLLFKMKSNKMQLQQLNMDMPKIS